MPCPDDGPRVVGDGVLVVDPRLEDQTIFDRDESRIRVLRDRCGTCILGGRDSLAKRMNPGELKRFLNGARNSYVICHSTGPETATQAAVCRGWAEEFGGESTTYQRLLEWIGPTEVELEGEQGAAGSQRTRSAGVDDRSCARDGVGTGDVRRADAVAGAAQHGGEGVARDRNRGAGGHVGGRVHGEVTAGSELVSLNQMFDEQETGMAAKSTSSSSGSDAAKASGDQAEQATAEKAQTPAQSSQQDSSSTPSTTATPSDGTADAAGGTAPADQTSAEQVTTEPVGAVQGADEGKQIPDPDQYGTDEWKQTHGPDPRDENPDSDY